MRQNDVLTIKRYPNRRLYDTRESAYINISQLIDRIKAGQTIEVVDSKTGTDLTRETLLQALIEEDKRGQILPNWVIFQMIRYRSMVQGSTFNELMERMFQLYFRGLDMYLSSQSRLPGLGDLFSPMKLFGEMLGMGSGRDQAPPTTNYNVYDTPPPPEADEEEPPAEDVNEELATLKARLAELERAVSTKKKKK